MGKSKEGWAYVERKGFRYYFKQSFPRERRYFINPIFDSSNGFHYLFHRAKLSYGVSKSQNTLNKQSLDIFEIDSNKIDNRFWEILHYRNKYCMNHFFRILLLSVLLLVGSIVTFCITETTETNSLLIVGIVLMIPIICYSLVCLIILLFDDRMQRLACKEQLNGK